MTPEGIHDGTSAEEYHADPCEQPSLSAHIAALLCNRSPKHAWAAHPRLNPDFERVDEQKFDVGTAAHAILLCRDESGCVVIDAPDWRTKAAQEQRDEARANGKVPLLVKHFEEVQRMCVAVNAQLAEHDVDPPLLTAGKPEQTLIWEEQGITCRARLDWLRDDRIAIDDLKTTSGSANPNDWTRNRLWDIGAEIQAAFYMRAVRQFTGDDPLFRWIVVENTPPYALSVISLAPSALALATEKVAWAITKWGECLAADHWPAYPAEVVYADTPTWQETAWLEARWAEEQGAAA